MVEPSSAVPVHVAGTSTAVPVQVAATSFAVPVHEAATSVAAPVHEAATSSMGSQVPGVTPKSAVWVSEQSILSSVVIVATTVDVQLSNKSIVSSAPLAEYEPAT